MSPDAVIEVYHVGSGEIRYRPVCACNWVGPTGPSPWGSADAYRVHYDEAHYVAG